MRFLNLFKNRQDLALVGLLMTIVLVMIIPLPTFLIDSLIVLNISLTILILIVAVYLKQPSEFSAFPAIILIATTFRLAVSISTTRMILAQADAGAIIDTFGTFVTQGKVVVGLVIFLIITTVQFIVITKGSERVAEVAARFTLDALPGRQMSIDSELRSGDISPNEAIRRRKQLEKENQFFGAMDGAMKFVKGDAIAGLIIISINLLGGMAIGMFSDGMSASAAGQVYTRLTVGDGLVSQLPALIMAICAGAIITRVTTERQNDLGTDIAEQLSGTSKSLWIGALLIGGMGFIPGFPTSIFLVVAAVLGIGGWFMMKGEKAIAENELGAHTVDSLGIQGGVAREKSSLSADDDIFKIEIGSEVGKRLNHADFILARNEAIIKGCERTGISLPTFGLEEDHDVDPEAVIISLDNVAVFSGTIPQGLVVAICEAEVLELNGCAIVPVSANWPLRSAYWVEQADMEKLREVNVEVIETSELLARLGAHYLTTKASNILGYKLVQEIVRDLGKEHDQLASQVSQALSPVQLLNVLRLLLDDGVPLIPRRILFEALLEGTLSGSATELLAEQARRALSRQICANYSDGNRIISGYVLEPEIEEDLRACVIQKGDEFVLSPEGRLSETVLREVAQVHNKQEMNAKPAVMLVAPELRRPLAKYLKQHNLAFHVIAFPELAGEFEFHPVGTLGANYAGGNNNQEHNYEHAAE